MDTPTRPCLGLALSPELASQLKGHLPRQAFLRIACPVRRWNS